MAWFSLVILGISWMNLGWIVDGGKQDFSVGVCKCLVGRVILLLDTLQKVLTRECRWDKTVSC